MGDKSKIEWTDATWNPTTGCTKIAAGCARCYAAQIAKRFWGERKFTDVRTHPERLELPLRWKKPRRIFVDSMSDLFHPDVPFEFIDQVFEVMGAAERHTFQILTKRPQRMLEWLDWTNYLGGGDFLQNVWLGVSVAVQKDAEVLVPLLLETTAAVHFVSYEPALGPVKFAPSWLSDSDFDTVSWIICGCESGPGARPMNPDWARSLRDQCVSSGVSFFLKQMIVDGALTKLPELDGCAWQEYPDGR